MRYVAPANVEDVVSVLSEADEPTCLVGGGTWVVPELASGTRSETLLVDLRHAALDRIAPRPRGGIRVGATCTYTALLNSDLVARHAPLLRLMAASVTGGPPIRNQGTVGGSLVAARPASDVPAVLVALRASAVVAGPSGLRHVAADEFAVDAFQAGVAATEVLTAIDIPAWDSHPAGYYKLAFGSGSPPIATAAVILGKDGGWSGATLALGAATRRPLQVDLSHLQNLPPCADPLEDVRRLATDTASQEPYEDVLADRRYRLHTVGVAAGRAVRRALDGSAGPSTEEGALT